MITFASLFGFQEKEDEATHCARVTKMIDSDRIIWTPKTQSQPEFDDLGFILAKSTIFSITFSSLESTIDMEQIFNRVEHAKENSQIWIFVKSPFITNKPHAVGVAAMAQTKVIEIFNLQTWGSKVKKIPKSF